MSFNKILKLGALPIFLLLWITSIAFPKNKRLWVFGAWYGQSYSDNSRYLYEYVCINEPEVMAVWLTRNNNVYRELKKYGKKVYLTRSLKGFWIALRAGIVFVSSDMLDVNFIACHGALKVQLWHGIPLKKIGLDDKIYTNPDSRKSLILLRSIWRKIFDSYNLVVSSSPIVSERFVTAFGIKKEQILLTGYPRNDVILNNNPLKINILEDLKHKWDADKVILYAPTFRKEENDGKDLFRDLDMQKLNECLISHNAAFVIKLHYVQREQTILSNKEINHYHMHLFNEDEAQDINYILPYTGILITDYSSVYFDYLLLNRPIIFTPFDIENYTVIHREFYEDYDNATPGPKCRNWDEVIKALDDVLCGNDEYKQSRMEKRRIYNIYADTGNCERIIKEIKSRVLTA